MMKPDTTRQALTALREFSVALNQAIVYGGRHPLTAEAAKHAYHTLRNYLDCIQADFLIARVDDGIVVNNQPVYAEGPVSRVLVPTMDNFSLNSLSIQPGISHSGFLKLIQILAKGTQYKTGQVSQSVFKRALEVAGVDHVGIHMVRYERVRDDEKIVAKAVVVEEAKPSGKSVEKRLPDTTFADAVDREDLKIVTDITGKMLQKPRDFSRLILGVLERPHQSDTDTEKFLALIAQALEDVFRKLPETPTALRAAARKVEKLRKQLLEDGRMFPFVKPLHKEKLDELLTTTGDAVKVDMIAEEYRKRKEALAKTEKQISRFMKRKGVNVLVSAGLRNKLATSGMSFGEWSGLSVPSAKGGKKNGKGGAVERLQTAAEKLRKAAHEPESQTVEEALRIAEEAGQELAVMTGELAEKIRAFVAEEKSRQNKEDRTPTARKSARRKLLAKLAEIVQELCQPLSVITASIDMIAASHLGEVNESQLAMLKLAGEGAERMQKLIYALMEITDVPEDLHPDQEIISQLYE